MDHQNSIYQTRRLTEVTWQTSNVPHLTLLTDSKLGYSFRPFSSSLEILGKITSTDKFSKRNISLPNATRIKLYTLLFFFQIFCLTSFSQKQLQFEHIGTGAGLSQSNVICIFQDSRGFMWFGTRDGLNKYDGYKFIVYKFDEDEKNSLSHNTIYDIKEDHDGNLWLATWGGGVNKFDRSKEIFTRHKNEPGNPNSIRKDHINRLLVDSEGNLWIATEGGGLNILETKTGKISHYVHRDNDPASLSNDNVKDIKEDKDHNLWVGTGAGGIDLFDRKTKKFVHYESDIKNLDGGLLLDSKDQLWIGTTSGLLLFDKTKKTFEHFNSKPIGKGVANVNVIYTMAQDDKGNIWIGTQNEGIYVLDVQTRTFQNYIQDDADNSGLNDNSIRSIYRDKKGNMWVGTFSSGINLMNHDAGRFAHYRHDSSPTSLANNKVLAIFEDSKRNIWIGTDGGGIDLMDGEKGSFTHYMHDPSNKNSLSGNYVLAIAEDGDGNLWIGTWGNGITVFNKDKNTFKRYTYDPSKPEGLSSPNIRAIYKDGDNNIWLSCYSAGISKYDKENDRFIHFLNDPSNPAGIANNYINFLWEDRDKNLWIGTNGSGLDLFNKKTNTFTHFPHVEGKNSISNSDVYSMIEDKNGDIWIGTGRGLNLMNKKTGKFTSFYVKNGLPSNTITGLLKDKKENLWISTFNGISKLDVTNKSFKNYSMADGLQSSEFKMQSCFLSQTGKMYFGGINGFNEFSPDSIHESGYDPPLVFTDLSIFNKKILASNNAGDGSPLHETITDTRELFLTYDQSVISFEFASLNYTVQDKKQYRYMLEGFDKDWNDIGTRHTATYTNLNPGRYLLKVMGLNNDGKWSQNQISLSIVISPPYWQTWWFKILIFAVIVGSVLALYKIRIKNIQTQKTVLQEKVQEQTWQLVQAAKEEHISRNQTEQLNKELESKNKELEQFAFVASHDLQEPLRTTSSYVELLQRQYRGTLDERADKYLTFITQSSDRMKTLIKDLLEYSRIGRKREIVEIDCNIILQEVCADLAVVIKETGTKIKSTPLPVIQGSSTEIKQLFQNLLTNAIKFRKSNIIPEINIDGKKMEGCWEFSFKDNGIGIDEKHKTKIFEIFQRLHDRTKYEGSGIGLANCKKIVEFHRGNIWIKSALGSGSTFYFTICDDLVSEKKTTASN